MSIYNDYIFTIRGAQFKYCQNNQSSVSLPFFSIMLCDGCVCMILVFGQMYSMHANLFYEKRILTRAHVVGSKSEQYQPEFEWS